MKVGFSRLIVGSVYHFNNHFPEYGHALVKFNKLQ